MPIVSAPRDLTQTIRAATDDAAALLEETYSRMAEVGSRNVFIHQIPFEAASQDLSAQLQRRDGGEQLPLLGVPFAVKDNFDVAGHPTTAACPAFSYHPRVTAAAVERLQQAGAILIGKTNMDQFATGLVGVRSPYGLCRSALSNEHISGGSSSGSALAVALGVVPFALGTDTAGSGRVPAAFNGIVGLKPTRGVISARGVVPACRSLDCVSIFAPAVADAWKLFELMVGFDPADAFSRPTSVAPNCPTTGEFRLGVPRQLEFFGNRAYERAFAASVERLQAVGGQPVAIDLQPFIEAGQLLYAGPWVAERFAAVGDFIERAPESVDPVVREIILAGKRPAAHELFKAQYQLAELRRRTEQAWQTMDVLVLPTAGTIYTVDEVLAEPTLLNANLGRYTNFVNLLDLAGVALPSGTTEAGVPFGITLLGPAHSDGLLASIGKKVGA